jgi:hypothetical protein
LFWQSVQKSAIASSIARVSVNSVAFFIIRFFKRDALRRFVIDSTKIHHFLQYASVL